jgi:2-desacetyl-2-hydroxyethyl bacteriochlorophyllide A dehydrogenase
LATGYAAVSRAQLRAGATVAVLGGGPVGQLISLAAQACGAGVVVVVEPVADRRELAAAQGAVVAEPELARTLIDRVTDGRGADAVIDAVGGPRALDTACALVRRRGSVISVGVHRDLAWSLPVARAFADELTLRFVIGDAMRDGDALVDLVRSGAIDPTVLVSDTVGLDDVPEAYRRMADRRTLKTLIAV